MSKKKTTPISRGNVDKRLPKNIPMVIPTETAIDKPVQQEFYTRVKHMCNLGDIIAILPACKKYWEVTKRKIILSQQVNVPAAYYAGATHPTLDAQGTQVCINDSMFSMIKPLVESQEYIHCFERYEGQPIDLNFDIIRGQTEVGMPNLMIQCWIMFAFPDLDYDLSKTWVDLPEVKNNPIVSSVKGKVIVNFTERYRNPFIDYYFLKSYASDLIFAGTEKEHYLFCNRWGLTIDRLIVNDFLEYAYAIKNCRFLISNQSFGWNLATSIGTKRILEVCKFAPNCQPFIGEDSKGFFHQVGAEYYFKKFYNDTINK